MRFREWLRGLVSRLTAIDESVPTDAEVELDADTNADAEMSFAPDELERRIDTLKELGLPQREFVTRVIEEEGGQVRQQVFTDYTNWSEATISRVLSELEDDNTIVRVEIGREKVVCLPNNTPRLDSSAGEDNSDSTN